MMPRFSVVSLVAVIALCAGCELALRGVPILSRRQPDAAMLPDDDGPDASDGALEDGSVPSAPEDGSVPSAPEDGSVPNAPEDSSTPAPSDGDGSVPPEPMPDAATDPEPDAATPFFFADDFDRPNGALADAPWRMYASPGVETFGGVRDEQLCLSQHDVVMLVLPPDQYRYFHFEVPGGDGLDIRATLGNTELFSALWSSNKVTIPDADEANDDVSLGAQRMWQTLRLEVDVDHEGRKTRLTLNGEHRATVAFAPYDIADEWDAMLPLDENERANHLIVRIRRTASHDMACLDNFYVGTRRPTHDPFASADPVNSCRPSDAQPAGCLTKCCSELVALDAATCELDQDCFDSECICGGSIVSCAEYCLVEHPSHSLDACTLLCSHMLVGSEAYDYVACVEKACTLEPDPLEAELVPTSWSAVKDVPEADMNAALSMPPVAVGALGEARMLFTDFDTTKAPGDYFFVLGGDEVRFWADHTNYRFAAAVRQCSGRFRGDCRSWRLYTWTHDDPLPVVLPTEHRFPEAIEAVYPSPSLRYLSVVTASGGEYLLTHDGRVLLKEPFGVVFGPDEKYAYTGLGSTTLIDLVHGTRTVVPVPPGGSHVVAAFRDKLAWASDPWTYTDLAGNVLPSPLPGVSLKRVGEGFYASTDALYRVTPDGLARMATMPSGWTLADRPPRAVAATESHMLLVDEEAPKLLRIYKSDGSLIASHTPTPSSEEVEVFACTPSQGLLYSHAITGEWTIESFTLEGDSISTHRVLGGFNFTSERVSIQRQRDACAFMLAPSSGAMLRFDVTTGEQSEFTPPAGELSWATYLSE